MANTICHFEIPVGDLDQAREFYSTLFGWKITPAPETNGSYCFIQTSPEADALGGGLHQRQDEAHGAQLYVLVDSIDETAERVVGLGGALEDAKAAIPGFGWVATVSDPQGNRIGLFQEDGEAA